MNGEPSTTNGSVAASGGLAGRPLGVWGWAWRLGLGTVVQIVGSALGGALLAGLGLPLPQMPGTAGPAETAVCMVIAALLVSTAALTALVPAPVRRAPGTGWASAGGVGQRAAQWAWRLPAAALASPVGRTGHAPSPVSRRTPGTPRTCGVRRQRAGHRPATPLSLGRAPPGGVLQPKRCRRPSTPLAALPPHTGSCPSPGLAPPVRPRATGRAAGGA